MTSGRVCAPHQLGSAGSEVLLPGKGKTQHNKVSIQLEADTSPWPLSAPRGSDQQTKKGVTVLLGLLMLIAMESEVSGTYGDGRGMSGIKLGGFPGDSLSISMSANGYEQAKQQGTQSPQDKRHRPAKVLAESEEFLEQVVEEEDHEY